MAQTGLAVLIDQFLRKIKLYWQIVFLVSVVVYGVSFLHHLQFRKGIPLSPGTYKTLDQVFFVLALVLAVGIFLYKRKFFKIKYFQNRLEELLGEHPEADARQLMRLLLRELERRFKTVWFMGAALIALGVVEYWITFSSYNMNVYFVVGLYSIFLNYPRQDLLVDIPFLVQEVLKEAGKENMSEEMP